MYTGDEYSYLSEIHYCDFADESGLWEVIRGFTATFTNPTTGVSEVFQYGDLDTQEAAWTVNCHTLAISSIITEYNVKEWDHGISGFQFKDTDGNIYSPCIGDCTVDPVYSDFQPLQGPIIGFNVRTWDREDPGLLDLPIEISIVYNSCPCNLITFAGDQAPSDMTA